MRTFLITLTALSVVAVALPVVTANAQDRTVIVTKDRDHDRGLHRGWTRGHHYGWRNHNAKVVVIKKNRHHRYRLIGFRLTHETRSGLQPNYLLLMGAERIYFRTLRLPAKLFFPIGNNLIVDCCAFIQSI